LYRPFYKNEQKYALNVCQHLLHLIIAFQGACVVPVQIISDADCNRAYAAYGGITARMICAVVTGGDIIACQVRGS